MKTRVLSIFLILLLCLTAGCGKAAQQNQTPDGISFSGSKTEDTPDTNTSQAEEIFSAQTPESQSTEASDGTTTEKAEKRQVRKLVRAAVVLCSAAAHRGKNN